MAIAFPNLPFNENALEPYISEETLHFHHKKHHKKYVDTVNKLIPGTVYENMSLEEIMLNAHLHKDLDPTHKKIFNNSAQAWNHDFFWQCLHAGAHPAPSKELMQALETNFSSFDAFKSEFTEKGVNHFASGWLWLIKNSEGKPELVTRPDAENPLCENLQPLFTCDLWEHAYYLDYQNERDRFLENVFDVINWKFISERLSKPLSTIHTRFFVPNVHV